MCLSRPFVVFPLVFVFVYWYFVLLRYFVCFFFYFIGVIVMAILFVIGAFHLWTLEAAFLLVVVVVVTLAGTAIMSPGREVDW